jgi:hypothetical protein
MQSLVLLGPLFWERVRLFEFLEVTALYTLRPLHLLVWDQFLQHIQVERNTVSKHRSVLLQFSFDLLLNSDFLSLIGVTLLATLAHWCVLTWLLVQQQVRSASQIVAHPFSSHPHGQQPSVTRAGLSSITTASSGPKAGQVPLLASSKQILICVGWLRNTWRRSSNCLSLSKLRLFPV